ncbi:mitochondrial inner membrane protein OXA1-like [Rosa chinensis]|uniref:mitochondrial inner membrane protein OXA1-like n=1 Tax=Rosa chinensis TaxID=74649 RepID=UPI001AD933ED|nr:mitochondrial inner membrane protein OXA1-like [Rosa chinensis]XP_040372097.1 mitochondrial inner membrane protein OXA1-like [Rosa chinensis]XP_040372098.1 mitochondrial inner membrane protein OXA1-like [Rosa chinensis]
MMQSMPELRLVLSSSPPWKIRPNIQDKARRRFSFCSPSCRNTLLQHPRTRSCMSSSVPLDSRYGVTPFSQLKGLFIQGPIFISFFLAIRNMAEKVPSFQNGGALWFTDLTTPDSMLILPILTARTFWITVECNMQEGLEGNPVAQTMKTYSRILTAIAIPVMMSFLKALFCY